MQQHYDYIIAGAGCAGLSLLLRMMQDPFFNHVSILLADRDEKNRNDRTWCFWEQQPGLFEPVVSCAWEEIDFHAPGFSGRFQLSPYRYKMIRGIDLYRYVLEQAALRSNITIVQGEVSGMQDAGNEAILTINGQYYSARYIFSSILPGSTLQQQAAQKGHHYLLQHFKGWLIKTPAPFFDRQAATFMDFRISQDNGAAFVYVLPTSSNTALVEYTLFTENLLADETYDATLQHYLTYFLQCKEYSIITQEKGAIPMTSYVPAAPGKRIVLMGTAGGYTKGSSGYTFQFIQKHTAAVVELLKQQKQPVVSHPLLYKRFRLYDATLLQILQGNKMEAREIFAALFKANPVQAILRFLDNETSLQEEWKLMHSLPSRVFLPAALREIMR